MAFYNGQHYRGAVTATATPFFRLLHTYTNKDIEKKKDCIEEGRLSLVLL